MSPKHMKRSKTQNQSTFSIPKLKAQLLNKTRMFRPNSQPDPNDDRITPEPPVNEWETRARDVHSSLKVNTKPQPGRSWPVMTKDKKAEWEGCRNQWKIKKIKNQNHSVKPSMQAQKSTPNGEYRLQKPTGQPSPLVSKPAMYQINSPHVTER